jgi:hypothetical protein
MRPFWLFYILNSIFKSLFVLKTGGCLIRIIMRMLIIVGLVLLHVISHKKTRFFAADLRKWRRKKPKNSYLLAKIERQILDQQNLHSSL